LATVGCRHVITVTCTHGGSSWAPLALALAGLPLLAGAASATALAVTAVTGALVTLLTVLTWTAAVIGGTAVAGGLTAAGVTIYRARRDRPVLDAWGRRMSAAWAAHHARALPAGPCSPEPVRIAPAVVVRPGPDRLSRAGVGR